jgi:uncharacterized membrane protein
MMRDVFEAGLNEAAVSLACPMGVGLSWGRLNTLLATSGAGATSVPAMVRSELTARTALPTSICLGFGGRNSRRRSTRREFVDARRWIACMATLVERALLARPAS